MISVDTTAFLALVGVALAASLTFSALEPWLAVPVVVLELVFGVIVGPEVLNLAQPDEFIEFFANLGLGLLFFFAGYEIDLQRVRGRPLALAAAGWLLSLVIAYTLGGLLAASGFIISLLFVGTAMSTTAVGTLIPILGDAGELRTPFGTYLLAAGALGELGPIVLITILFGTEGTRTSVVMLSAFAVVAIVIAVLTLKSAQHGWHVLERTLESSSQIAVRAAVFIVFALVVLADALGLELLLGGFVAGIIARLAVGNRHVPAFESKLTALGFGFLIPFFFATSGMKLDLKALAEPATIAKAAVFLCLFLVVRGVPAMLLYRSALDTRDRAALAFFSATQLPLVVAITTIAVEKEQMRTSTAASLVGAAVVSTLVFPLVGLRIRRDRASRVVPSPEPSAA